MKDLAQIGGAIEWLGVQYKTILSPEQTGGSMSIVDSWSPAGSAPRHVHMNEDETFVILSGACKFWLDGDEFTAGAGESVFNPQGKVYTFKAVELCRIPEDMPAIEESAKRHNMAFTGPALD